MDDIGHKLTDKELAALEKRIRDMYAEASEELSDVIEEYFKNFKARDEKYKKLVEAGEMSEEEYKQWRLAQIGRGKRFEALRDYLAERIYKANEVAAAYINDATPGIYSLNRNYAAYTIEQVAGNVGFTLWDEETVRRLLVEEPNLMPHYPEARAVQRGIDLAYSKQQITAAVTSGILQGKSIDGIAKDLQSRIYNMAWSGAVRAARTAVTSAQNAGRQDQYEKAAAMGIKLRKRWIATKDNRTRHSHGRLDGQTVDIDKPFVSVLGSEMMFPGDKKGAVAADLYNCRCTMRTVEKEGIEAEQRTMRARNPETGRWEEIPEMTYVEWEAMKKAENPEVWEIYKKKGRNYSADQKQYVEYRAVLGKNFPSTFDGFQELKYNNPEEWAKTKTVKRQTQIVKNAPCETTKRKYTEYFLKPGANHAQEFFNVGYTTDDVLRLRYDMARQFDMSKAVDMQTKSDGAQTFNIYMELGVEKQRRFRTCWIMDTPESKPRIVTAFRNEGKNNDKGI